MYPYNSFFVNFVCGIMLANHKKNSRIYNSRGRSCCCPFLSGRSQNQAGILAMVKYSVAKEIAILKRGRERILFNAEYVDPLYFQRGGEQASDILSRLKIAGPFFTASPEICSHEMFLFFLKHSLIVPHIETLTGPARDCSKNGCSQKASGRSVYLLLSHGCNQKCIYCLNGHETYQSDKHPMMSEKVAYKAIETVFDSIRPDGSLEVVFFGGEPLLNWPLAKKVINYCETILRPMARGKNVKYHLTTNLTLFPQDLIKTALRYNITFLVDVDGPEDIHNTTRPFRNGKGTFKTTVRNIRKLTEAGLMVALRATITAHNHHKMLEIAQTHKEIGGSSCAFVPLSAVDSDRSFLPYTLCPSPKEFATGLRKVYNSGIWAREQLYPFNEYMGRLKPGFRNKWGCGAPWGNTPVVTSEGKIFSCIYLVGIGQFEIGDIFAGDYPRISVVQRMLDSANVDTHPDCSECKYRYLCGGGCPVGKFTVAGNPDTPDNIKRYTRNIACTTSRTVLEELLWDMSKPCKELAAQWRVR